MEAMMEAMEPFVYRHVEGLRRDWDSSDLLRLK